MIRNHQDIINAELNGNVIHYRWRKQVTQVTTAGYWFDLSMSPGNPGPKYWFDAAPLSSQQVKKSVDGGINHGGVVSPKQKVIRQSNYMMNSGVLSNFMLCDYLAYYPSIDDSVTDGQTRTNNFYTLGAVTFATPSDNPYKPNVVTHNKPLIKDTTLVRFTTTGTLPTGLTAGTDYYTIKISDNACRLATSYANAVSKTYIEFSDNGSGVHSMTSILPRYTDGEGVKLIAITIAGRVGGQGFTINYTNSKGVSGRTSPIVYQNTVTGIGTITNSGINSIFYFNPFIGLQEGDTGVRSIESVTMIGADVGLFALAIVKPLCQNVYMTAGMPSECDYLIDSVSLPIIEDDAYLSYLVNPQGSVSSVIIYGEEKFIFN